MDMYIERIKKRDMIVSLCLAIVYLYSACSPIRPFGVLPGLLLGGGLIAVFYFFRKWIIDRSKLPATLEIGVILLVGFVIRLLWIIFSDNTWVSDFSRYDTLSKNLLAGNYLSDREIPHGTSIITAFFYLIFGVNRYVALLPVVLASVAIIYLVYRLARNIFGEATAKVSAVLCSLCPEQIIYTNLINSDIYFAFFVLAAFYCLLTSLSSRLVLNVLLAGIFLGISQYIRSNSILFLFCGILFIVLYNSKKNLFSALRLGLVLIATYLAVLSPQMAFNYSNFKELTVNSSRGLGWFFFLSTNPVHNGKYNEEDFERWKEKEKVSKRLPHEDYTIFKYRVAMEMAKERFFASPFRFFVNIYKKPYLFLNDPASFKWSLNGLHNSFLVILIFAIGLVYHRALLVLCGMAYFSMIKIKDDEKIKGFLFLTSSAVLIVTFSHFFLEIQTRYHYMLMPFVIIGAASYFTKNTRVGVVQTVTNHQLPITSNP